jgi:hypothetical protein
MRNDSSPIPTWRQPAEEIRLWRSARPYLLRRGWIYIDGSPALDPAARRGGDVTTLETPPNKGGPVILRGAGEREQTVVKRSWKKGFVKESAENFGPFLGGCWHQPTLSNRTTLERPYEMDSQYKPSPSPVKWTCAQCTQETSSPHEILYHVKTRTYDKLGPKEDINKIFRCDN